MAKATAVIIPPVPVKPELESVTLTLNKNEAVTLLAIVRRCGGNPYDSRRKHADAIQRALVSVCVDKYYEGSQHLDWSGTPNPRYTEFGGSTYLNFTPCKDKGDL